MTLDLKLWKSESVVVTGGQVAALNNGGFMIVGENSGKIDTFRHDIFGDLQADGHMSYFMPDGKPLTRPHVSGTGFGAVIGYDYLQDTNNSQVGYMRVDEKGNIVHSPWIVYSSANEHIEAIGSNRNGNVVVVYSVENSGSDSDLWLSVYDSSGSELFETRVHANPSGAQRSGSISFLRNDNILVSWENYDPSSGVRDVRIAVYDSTGNPVLSEKVVGTTSNAAFPTVSALENGNAVIAWQDVTDQRMYYKVVDGNGQDVTVLRYIDEYYGILPVIRGLPDGGFVMAWSSYEGFEADGSIDGDVALQRFDASGNRVGAAYRIDQPGDQTLSDISLTVDGRIIVTYQSETGDSTDVHYDAFVILDPREASISGSDGDDVIVGRLDASVINGLDGHDALYGMGANDILNGGIGNDLIDGGAGDDILIGGSGNDTYVVDSHGDIVIEQAGLGTDTIKASLDYVLAAGLSVENLRTTVDSDTGRINLTGNELANRIVGNDGANILDGGAGADLVYGRRGDDVFIVSEAGDRVFETIGQGNDTVRASVSYVLAAGQSVETLRTTDDAGTAGIDLTGNDLGNKLVGNMGTNVLVGGGAADSLFGRGGADLFQFRSLADSTVAASGRDTIQDFSRAQGDRIDLHVIDAVAGGVVNQAFRFVGDAGFREKAGELRSVVSGTNTLVSGDVDGDGVADFAILIKGVQTLQAGDFIL